jgi:hypothetical protein
MYSSCSKSDNKCQKYGQKKNSTPLKSGMALTALLIFTKHTISHYHYVNIFSKKLHPSWSTNNEVLVGYSGAPARLADLYKIHRCFTDFFVNKKFQYRTS